MQYYEVCVCEWKCAELVCFPFPRKHFTRKKKSKIVSYDEEQDRFLVSLCKNDGSCTDHFRWWDKSIGSQEEIWIYLSCLDL